MSGCFGQFTTPALIVVIAGGALVMGGVAAMSWIVFQRRKRNRMVEDQAESIPISSIGHHDKLKVCLEKTISEAGVKVAGLQ